MLSLKLGVIRLIEDRREDAPVILLDDVESELDSARSEAFFRMITGAGRQVFITATDVASARINLSQAERRLFEVSGGVVIDR